MTKTIITAALGFFTIPMVVLLICGVVVSVKLTVAFIAGYGMEVEHYWAGFFMLVGLGVVFLSSLPFWI